MIMIGKVRVWDHKRKYFITDSYENCMYLRFDGTLVFITTVGEEMNPRGDYTIQRSVGLLDKNGKEIYEGDILSDNHEVIFESRFVQYGVNIPGARWFGLDEFCDYNTHEVIGNIYENPELLVKH